MEVNNSLAVTQSAAANPDHHPNFIEGNANAITLTDLRNSCIVPTWANNQLTISHPAFIETVLAAAQATFSGNEVNAPEIRVSHPVLGRVPGAIHKKPQNSLIQTALSTFRECVSASLCLSMTSLTATKPM